MILTVYLKLPVQIMVLIRQCNRVFYGCINHILFAYTQLESVISTVIKHVH